MCIRDSRQHHGDAVVVVAVRNAPQQPLHAADLQKIRPLGELAAQLVQLLRDSRQAVTLDVYKRQADRQYNP